MIQKHFATSAKKNVATYDALLDKHASFYFNGYGIKKHLKKLKKAISQNPYQKGSKMYSQMLAQKLTELQTNNDTQKHKIKPYQQTLKPASLQKLQKLQFNIHQVRHPTNHTRNDQSPETKQNISHNNLPSIVKNKKGLTKIKQTNNNKFFEIQKPQKQDKSLSFATKDNQTKIKQLNNMNLNRERNNKSVQVFRKSIKNDTHETNNIKEVKHQDFMNFLKKRQEDISKMSNVMHQPKKTNYIKEEISDQF